MTHDTSAALTAAIALDEQDRAASRTRHWGHRALRSPLFWIVGMPVLIAAIYLFLIAAPQYRSEAQFVIRGLDSPRVEANGFGQLLGVTPTLDPSAKATYILIEYLRSPEAIAALKARKIDLVTIFRRPEADFVARLSKDDAPMEDLLKYYRNKVQIGVDSDTGIARDSVTAFRPDDARAIARTIIALGEERINQINERLFSNTVTIAREEFGEAADELSSAQVSLSLFRNRSGDIDPESSGKGEQEQAITQQAGLDRQRARLSDMRRYLSPTSPQVVAMEGYVRSLEAAAARGRGRLTGAPGAVSQRLGEYEELGLKQELAAKRYEAARLALQAANERVEKEQLFVLPVVRPTVPEKPVYPKPFRTLATILMTALLLYAFILIVTAGIREHRA
jgi:capsular polysaccharide transport system permease protein